MIGAGFAGSEITSAFWSARFAVNIKSVPPTVRGPPADIPDPARLTHGPTVASPATSRTSGGSA